MSASLILAAMELCATICLEVSSFVCAPMGTLGHSVKARYASQNLVRQTTLWNAIHQIKEVDFNAFAGLDFLENDAKLEIANYQ